MAWQGYFFKVRAARKFAYKLLFQFFNIRLHWYVVSISDINN
jgi:hypothetical protein